MTMDLSELTNFISRKFASVALLGVFLYELPDFGHPGIVIAKIVIAGGAVVVYTYCTTKQNIAEMKYLKTDPDLTDGEGNTHNTFNNAASLPPK
jgi:hypothetical protein